MCADIRPGIVCKPSNRIDIGSVARDIFRSRPPQWDGGLDDCAKAGTARMDWSFVVHTADRQHESGLSDPAPEVWNELIG